MATNVDKIVFLLAASGLSERAIYDALKTFRAAGAEEIIDRVQLIRHSLMGPGGQRLLNEVGVYSIGEDRHRTQVVDRVMQLLQIEAGLTPSQAAQLLLKSLSGTTSRQVPQFKPKEGLRSWITRLVSQFTNSELLHHATKIRNQIVHSGHVDWPLREREE